MPVSNIVPLNTKKVTLKSPVISNRKPVKTRKRVVMKVRLDVVIILKGSQFTRQSDERSKEFSTPPPSQAWTTRFR